MIDVLVFAEGSESYLSTQPSNYAAGCNETLLSVPKTTLGILALSFHLHLDGKQNLQAGMVRERVRLRVAKRSHCSIKRSAVDQNYVETFFQASLY